MSMVDLEANRTIIKHICKSLRIKLMQKGFPVKSKKIEIEVRGDNDGVQVVNIDLADIGCHLAIYITGDGGNVCFYDYLKDEQLFADSLASPNSVARVIRAAYEYIDRHYSIFKFCSHIVKEAGW